MTARPFDELADRTWGPDNWVTCPLCPDSFGDPSRHHVNFHDDQRPRQDSNLHLPR